MKCKLCGYPLMEYGNKTVCPYCGYGSYGQPKTEKEVDYEKNKQILFDAQSCLKNNVDGSLDYLHNIRKLDDEAISRWSLGYTNTLWKSGRIVLPYFTSDEKQITGFGGRLIDNTNDSKYINTSFDKSSTVFGIQLLPKKCGRIYLPEGYFDAISLDSIGIRPVVAKIGTVLPKETALLLRTRTKAVTVVTDTDEAGKNAVKQNIQSLLKANFKPENINIMYPTDGKDIDEAVHRHFTAEEIPLFDYLRITGDYETMFDCLLRRK